MEERSGSVRPLTRSEIWDAERKSELFQRAFDLEPRFVWVREAEKRAPKLRLAAS